VCKLDPRVVQSSLIKSEAGRREAGAGGVEREEEADRVRKRRERVAEGKRRVKD
jgi:hypothetical protein